MRPLLQEILAQLLARHRGEGRVYLNDIAEVIGLRAVTYAEVEQLLDALEAEGLRVGEPLDHQDIQVMQAVLGSARRLRATLGRPPTVDEVAEDTGRPAHQVRRALEHGKHVSPPGAAG